MRLRCVVAYDGTDFAGWQRQADRRSVQATIEGALSEVTGEIARVVGAGRTDAGVHAIGQVAHFDTRWARPTTELGRAVNAVLPDDVAMSALAVAPSGFHARNSACARTYRYEVHCGADRSPLARRTTLHVTRPIDLARFAEAAGRLIGTHDFGGVGRPMTPEGSTVRTISSVAVAAEEDRISVVFEADAFLRHQVRRMMGLMLDIGTGRFAVEAVDEILARRPAAPVARRAAARGLTLWAVRYPPEEARWPMPQAHARE